MRALLRVLLLALALPVHAEPIRFGLIGDLPYNARERAALEEIIAAMNREPLAFVVHVGDIKSGLGTCSDGLYDDIRGLFQQSRHPLVYLPGDNEWTDCGRSGQDPLERLDRLRQIFFADDRALGGRPLEVIRQRPDFPENVLWRAGGFLFVGLNVPGSNNNRGRAAVPPAEFRARGGANRAWLAAAFQTARRERLAGVVVLIQANPGFEKRWWSLGGPDGYREFIDQLRQETQAFPGQVVLVHGDTHDHKVDRPLKDPESDRPLANFTRVETYGSPFPGWVEGTIDASPPATVRFAAHPWGARTGDSQYPP